MLAGERATGSEPFDRPLEHHLTARSACARAEVDRMIGNRDRLRLVFDHQHGVALVAQPKQQVIHPIDVVWVQPNRRLVEDVGDISERRPEMPDHLGALRLPARECAGGAFEAEVAKPDLDERVEGLPQRCQ